MKKLIWLLFSLPLLYLLYRLGFEVEFLHTYSQTLEKLTFGSLGAFPADPVKFISDITGITALQFLIATLTVTPLRRYTKLNLLKQRRLLGLMSFFYAFLHMFLYLHLDHDLSLTALFKEALDKVFIFFGMASMLLLFFLALTSTKRGFKRLLKWHQLIYLAAVLIALHYLLSQKLLTLLPLIYTAIILILLRLRKDKIQRIIH